MHQILECPHGVLGERAVPDLYNVVVEKRLVVVEGAGVRRHDVAQEGGAAAPGRGHHGPHRLLAPQHPRVFVLEQLQLLRQESLLLFDGTINF